MQLSIVHHNSPHSKKSLDKKQQYEYSFPSSRGAVFTEVVVSIIQTYRP